MWRWQLELQSSALREVGESLEEEWQQAYPLSMTRAATSSVKGKPVLASCPQVTAISAIFGGRNGLSSRGGGTTAELTLHCDGLMCAEKKKNQDSRIKVKPSCEFNKLEAMSRSTSEACEGRLLGCRGDRWITWRLVFRLVWSRERGQVNLRSENELTLRRCGKWASTVGTATSEGALGGVVRCDDVTNGNLWVYTGHPHRALCQPHSALSASDVYTTPDWKVPALINLDLTWVGRRVRHVLHMSCSSYSEALRHRRYKNALLKSACGWACHCVVSRCGWAGSLNWRSYTSVDLIQVAEGIGILRQRRRHTLQRRNMPASA